MKINTKWSEIYLVKPKGSHHRCMICQEIIPAKKVCIQLGRYVRGRLNTETRKFTWSRTPLKLHKECLYQIEELATVQLCKGYDKRTRSHTYPNITWTPENERVNPIGNVIPNDD